ncbi:MAG: SCO family protein [Acidimicrobiales bacterium]|nr:SCO family protein [Acidimicrobiales bacterium]
MGSRPDRRRRSAAVLAVAAALVLAACSSDGSDGAAATSGSSELAPTGATEIEGLVRDDPLQVGDATLPEVAADGSTQPFSFRAPEGDLLFVAFGYTNCPDVCPTTLYDIKKARQILGDQADRVEVAFATVDPDRDDAETMTAYLGSFVDGGHPLRTADHDELVAAEEAFGVTSQVVTADDGTVEVAHTARSFVVDDAGQVVVEWAFGTDAEVMANDLLLLLAAQDEAS